MRTFITILLIVGCYYAGAQTKNEKQVRVFLKQWAAAWNSGNMDTHMSFYRKNDSTLRITNHRGLKWGWQTIYEDFKHGYPDSAAMGKTFVDVVSIKRLSPRYCYAVVRSGLVNGTDAQRGYLGLLLEKVKKRWYIVVEH